MTNGYRRRHVLRILGATGGAATVTALAGCSGSSDKATKTDGGSNGDSSGGSGGDGGTSWTKTKTIDMTDDLKFDPDHVQVSAGTKVTWKNSSGIGHTVTAYEDELPDGASYFASGDEQSEQDARDAYKSDKAGVLSKGDTYTHTFEQKGTYKYFCIPHEMSGMVGYVKVV